MKLMQSLFHSFIISNTFLPQFLVLLIRIYISLMYLRKEMHKNFLLLLLLFVWCVSCVSILLLLVFLCFYIFSSFLQWIELFTSFTVFRMFFMFLFICLFQMGIHFNLRKTFCLFFWENSSDRRTGRFCLTCRSSAFDIQTQPLLPELLFRFVFP